MNQSVGGVLRHEWPHGEEFHRQIGDSITVLRIVSEINGNRVFELGVMLENSFSDEGRGKQISDWPFLSGGVEAGNRIKSARERLAN